MCLIFLHWVLSKLMKNTIDRIKGENILLVNFCGMTPHLETSLEIARRLSDFNQVSYIHLGNNIPRPTLFSSNYLKRKFQLRLRIERAMRYLEKYVDKKSKFSWINPKSIVYRTDKLFRGISKRDLKPKIETLDDLKNLKYKEFDIGIGIASTLISYLRDSNPFPLNSKAKTEFHAQHVSSIKSIIFAELLLDLPAKYDSIVLFNGRYTCENAFKQVALFRNLKIYYYERGYDFKRFFFENYMPHDLTKRKEEMELLNHFFPAEEINSIGSNFYARKASGDGVYERSYVSHQLTKLSDELTSEIKIQRKRNAKIISFFTSSDDEYKFIDANSTRYPYWGNQILAIRTISSIIKSLGFYLIVRVHPHINQKSKNEQNRWHLASKSIVNQGFSWISPNNLESTYQLVRESDLVISSGSTVGIEAIALGKPSIVINECFYDGPTSSVKLCESPELLKECLIDQLTYEPPSPSNAYIYATWVMFYGTLFKYYFPTAIEHGLMEDKIRIASAGTFQKIISKYKKIIKLSN